MPPRIARGAASRATEAAVGKTPEQRNSRRFQTGRVDKPSWHCRRRAQPGSSGSAGIRALDADFAL
jgi:hypothetical protein